MDKNILKQININIGERLDNYDFESLFGNQYIINLNNKKNVHVISQSRKFIKKYFFDLYDQIKSQYTKFNLILNIINYKDKTLDRCINEDTGNIEGKLRKMPELYETMKKRLIYLEKSGCKTWDEALKKTSKDLKPIITFIYNYRDDGIDLEILRQLLKFGPFVGMHFLIGQETQKTNTSIVEYYCPIKIHINKVKGKYEFPKASVYNNSDEPEEITIPYTLHYIEQKGISIEYDINVKPNVYFGEIRFTDNGELLAIREFEKGYSHLYEISDAPLKSLDRVNYDWKIDTPPNVLWKSNTITSAINTKYKFLFLTLDYNLTKFKEETQKKEGK